MEIILLIIAYFFIGGVITSIEVKCGFIEGDDSSSVVLSSFLWPLALLCLFPTVIGAEIVEWFFKKKK